MLGRFEGNLPPPANDLLGRIKALRVKRGAQKHQFVFVADHAVKRWRVISYSTLGQARRQPLSPTRVGRLWGYSHRAEYQRAAIQKHPRPIIAGNESKGRRVFADWRHK